MTCIIKRAPQYSSFVEPQLEKMPQRNPDSVNEYSKDNAGPACRSVTASSAAAWEKPRTTVLVLSAGEEESKRGERVASPEDRSHQLLLPQPWWESQLAKEIHSTLQGRERMLAAIKFESPQLNIRVHIVDFINGICKSLPIADTTRHLAVLLMDHFMDRYSIMDFRLKLVALTSLLIAAKLEDRDDNLPTISQLKNLAKLNNTDDYNLECFHKMELSLMKFFSWSISYPTAAHFVGFYISSTCQLEELNEEDLSDISSSVEAPSSQDELFSTTPQELDLVGPACDLDEMAYDMHLKSKDFHCQLDDITGALLERALRDYRFLQFYPSMVAAGAVCTALSYLQCTNIWSLKLEEVTGYSRQDLEEVVELFHTTSP